MAWLAAGWRKLERWKRVPSTGKNYQITGQGWQPLHAVLMLYETINLQSLLWCYKNVILITVKLLINAPGVY